MRLTNLASAAVVLLCVTSSSAQDPEPEPEPEPEPQPEPEPPPPPAPPPEIHVTVQMPPSEDAKPKDEKEDSDHDAVVGRMGVSWFGLTNVPIATGTPGGTSDDPSVNPGEPTFVAAPAIGIRYWFSSAVGIDAGLGFSVSSGSVDTTTSAEDKATVVAVLLHLGLPLSLVDGKHISLQLIPELNLGSAQSEVEPAVQLDPPPNADLSGVRLDVGARIGAEVHWGFIGIPELALEASVGAYFTYQGTSIAIDEIHASQRNILFSTAEYNSPWDFFTQHLRARYYF